VPALRYKDSKLQTTKETRRITKGMNVTEMKSARTYAKRAREQRNASATDQAFDYWHGVMIHYESLLKTEEKK
jgi:hypothetical protein